MQKWIMSRSNIDNSQKNYVEEIPRKTPSKVINNSSEMKYEVFSVFKLDSICKKPLLSEY